MTIAKDADYSKCIVYIWYKGCLFYSIQPVVKKYVHGQKTPWYIIECKSHTGSTMIHMDNLHLDTMPSGWQSALNTSHGNEIPFLIISPDRLCRGLYAIWMTYWPSHWLWIIWMRYCKELSHVNCLKKCICLFLTYFCSWPSSLFNHWVLKYISIPLQSSHETWYCVCVTQCRNGVLLLE